MARTPIKSDAQGGAGVIRLYPHRATSKALANAQARLDRGELENKRSRLTAKQEAFAQAMDNGLTQADAIRQAYNVENSSPQAIYVMAAKNMNNPKIAGRIVELKQARDRVTSLDGVALRSFVAERLKLEAEQASQPGARVRALELLGKLTEVGAFAEQRIDLTPRKTEQQVEQEIKDLLERLRPQPG